MISVNDGDGPEARPYADFFYWPHFSILAQLPSLSIPCGSIELQPVEPEGLVTMGPAPLGAERCRVPFGMQLVGRPHADAALVAIAAEIHGAVEKWWWRGGGPREKDPFGRGEWSDASVRLGFSTSMSGLVGSSQIHPYGSLGWSHGGLHITKSSSAEVPEDLFEKLRGECVGHLTASKAF